jgi:hypothetical protein
MNLSAEPKIIGLANSLSLLEGDPVENIRKFCLERVSGFIHGARGTLTMDRLQEVVCAKLGLRVHWIQSDFELNRLADEYIGIGEIVFATLAGELSPDAFGVLIQLQRPTTKGEHWVAVIDCRDNKVFRKHWTLWHEIAHCLTAVGQMQLPLRRTTDAPQKDPVEVITDLIASDFAFYAPIFNPVLQREVAKNDGLLSFAVVTAVRAGFCPEASFHSTLNACVSSLSSPYLVLDVRSGYNKSEAAAVAAGKSSIKPALRIFRASPNEEGSRVGLWIPQNFRIPDHSVIFEAHRTQSARGLGRREDLGTWTDSRGRSLAARSVEIQARRSGDHALALVRDAA